MNEHDINSNRLTGKRYINWARCSTDSQAETSIPDQLRLLTAFADRAGMIHVDNVVLDGVTGSVPGARDDVADLVRRKLERDDFDVVLLQDMSRLTRSGYEHAAKIEYDLRAVGVEVVFAAEQLPQGDFAPVVKSVGFVAAQQFAKSVSFNIARGQMSALLRGSMPYCSTPPYGVDRLITTDAGEPLFVLRDLADGSQEKRSADGTVVLQVTPPSGVKGRSNRYRRQANERVVLVMGDPRAVQVVRDIYRWHHRDGWGRHRIASELNGTKVAAPRGGTWTTALVASVLRNSIYLGASVANRTTRAIYHTRSPDAPARSQLDARELLVRKAPRSRVRDASEWVVQEHAGLKDYLDEDVRELAAAEQARYWTSRSRRTPPPISRDRHLDSPYVLSQLLKEKGTGLRLSGRTTGPKGRKIRYYAVTRAVTTPSAGITSTLVRAEPLERAVLEQVRAVVADYPALRQVIREQLEAESARTRADGDELPRLEARREELARKLEWVIDHLGTLGETLAAEKVEEVRRELATLDVRIGAARTARTARASAAPDDLNARAEAIAKSVVKLAADLGSLPTVAVRRLLEAVVERLEIDLHTMAVELDVHLPPWAVQAAVHGGALCLEGNPLWRTANEAQRVSGLKIGEVDCQGQRKPTRFDCCRRRKAA